MGCGKQTLFHDFYIEGAMDFICGDGQSFYQVKSIKKTQCFKNHTEYGSIGLSISNLFSLDLI